MQRIAKLTLIFFLASQIAGCWHKDTGQAHNSQTRSSKISRIQNKKTSMRTAKNAPRDKLENYGGAPVDKMQNYKAPADNIEKYQRDNDCIDKAVDRDSNLASVVPIEETKGYPKDELQRLDKKPKRKYGEHRNLFGNNKNNIDIGFDKGPRRLSKQAIVAKDKYKSATGGTSKQAAVNTIRANMLRETALSIGARGGLAQRAQEINGMLSNYERVLARVFNFYGLVLDDNVLPPVLAEGRNTLNLQGTDIIRIADRNYKILQQARFVTAPPTWREYLQMNYTFPEIPDKSLLPRNKYECQIWEHDIEDGWKAGVQQADVIFLENLNRLRRDYKGMILYRKLLMQNMVSPPYVAALDMGVTGDGSDMSVNDRILRITAFPALQTDGSKWKTQIRLIE